MLEKISFLAWVRIQNIYNWLYIYSRKREILIFQKCKIIMATLTLQKVEINRYLYIIHVFVFLFN